MLHRTWPLLSKSNARETAKLNLRPMEERKTYGATDMLITGRPDQYSTDLESPRRRAVIKALVAVL
jgi:hypothetical protein